MKKILLLLCLSYPSWGAYSFVKTIPLDHTKVSATLTNYPMVVSGTYAQLRTTGNGGLVTNVNGYDMVFTSDAGCTTIIPFERETWSATTGAVNLWVLVASFSNTVDGAIYLCAGNSSVTTDQSNAAGVWATNYVSVWHEVDVSSITSSIGSHTCTNSSSINISGQIDGASAFNGSASQNCGTSTTLAPSAMTFSAWISFSSLPNAYNSVVSRENGPTGYTLLIKSNGKLAIYVHDSSGTTVDYDGTGSNTLVANTPYLVAFTYVAGGTLIGYVNGTQDGTIGATANGLDAPAATAYIGNSSLASRGWVGWIDEPRITSDAKTASWLAADYTNQSNATAFINDVTLTFIATNAGNITTSDNSFSGDCNSSCGVLQDYPIGSTVTINTSVAVSTWVGCDSSTATSCTFTISSNRTIEVFGTNASTQACPWARTQTDVTGSRSFGTVYQNTGSSPLFVDVTGTWATNSTMQLTAYVSPFSTPTSNNTVAVGGQNFNATPRHVTFVVPRYAYYEVVSDQVTSTVGSWVEWSGNAMDAVQTIQPNSARVIGTVYQNTSGSIMFVSASGIRVGALSGTMNCLIGATSSPATTVVSYSQAQNIWQNLGCIVPPNYYYKITTDNALTNYFWTEWYFTSHATVAVNNPTVNNNTPTQNSDAVSALIVSGVWPTNGTTQFEVTNYSGATNPPTTVTDIAYTNVTGSIGSLWFVPPSYYYQYVTASAGFGATNIYTLSCTSPNTVPTGMVGSFGSLGIAPVGGVH